MSDRYSIDIYRTDDAILIHDRPGGWKRAILGLLLGALPVYFVIFIVVALYYDPPQQVAAQQQMAQHEQSLWEIIGAILVFLVVVPAAGFMIFSFACVFLFSLWRIGGHETLLIDRDSIRNDWWCFWGRRSRIIPRPKNIQTEAIPGFLITGGSWGVQMRFGKRRMWFGKRKFYMYLPSNSERSWLFDEIARFQREVPTSQPVDEMRPVQKGAYSDQAYGENLLDSLDLDGQKFVRVVPGNESAITDESRENPPSDVLPMRCVKCHRIVPHEDVSLEPLVAKCPHCQTLFQPNELERSPFPKLSRVRIRSDENSLEIVQKPHRGGMVLSAFFCFLLFDAVCVAFYLYLQQLMPGEDPLMAIRAEGDPQLAIGYRQLVLLAVLHIACLFLPAWAFFDKRTIHIDRETLRITGSWFYIFRWRRTAPRVLIKRASFRPWEYLFHQARLSYGGKFVYIGCYTDDEVNAICCEINHFLYTVLPSKVEPGIEPLSEPAFLGGVDSGAPELSLHCNHCGTQFPGDSIDIANRVTHCPSCQKDAPLEDAILYPCKGEQNTTPEGLFVEKSDECLAIRYEQHLEKGMKYFTLIAYYFCIFMFGGMYTALFPALFFGEDAMRGLVFLIFFVIFMLPLGIMIIFIYFMLSQDKNSMYCDWSIRVTPEELTIEHRYKKHIKTIVIDRKKIVRVEPNRDLSIKTMYCSAFGTTYPRTFLENRSTGGSHILLVDGTKQYLPLLSLNRQKTRDTTAWLAATLNEFLARHPSIECEHDN